MKEEFRYKVIRSEKRAKTIGFEINKEGLLIIRAPAYCSDADIQKAIDANQEVIRRAFQRFKANADKRESGKDSAQRLSGDEIRELAEKALDHIPKRVAYYAPKVGVDYGRITIRNQKTRWGSCSSKGNLNFNCLLMLTPPEVIDSVVVHELCHRLEMNHSPRFYAEVYRVFPEYDKWHGWLNKHGEELMRRMTGM